MGDQRPMSIAALKVEQARLGLECVHLVHLAEDGFTIAHTDVERASGEPLEDCALHRWLMSRAEPPADVGVWVAAKHIPDASSEPYGADPWDFEPIDAYETLASSRPGSREGHADD